MKCKNWSNKLNNFVVRKLKSFKINGQQQVLSSTMPAMPKEKQTTPISLDENNFDEIKMKEQLNTSNASIASAVSSASSVSRLLRRCSSSNLQQQQQQQCCCQLDDCSPILATSTATGSIQDHTTTTTTSIINSSNIQNSCKINNKNHCCRIDQQQPQQQQNYCSNCSSTSSSSNINNTSTTNNSNQIYNMSRRNDYLDYRNSMKGFMNRNSPTTVTSSSSISSTSTCSTTISSSSSTTTTTLCQQKPIATTSSSSSFLSSSPKATVVKNVSNSSCNCNKSNSIDNKYENRMQYNYYNGDSINKIPNKSTTTTGGNTYNCSSSSSSCSSYTTAQSSSVATATFTSTNATSTAAATRTPNGVQQQQQQQVLPKKTPNDFIFEQYLGEGSFSTVYHAKEVRTKKEVAIKVCEKAHILREKKQEYVKREREVMHRMSNCPGFVNLYCTFQDETRLYFVMTYAKNGDLLPHINKVGSFDLECTQHYAAELILACENMHKRGIVHRDLKPENILLDENMHTLIADFGSAKIIDNNYEIYGTTSSAMASSSASSSTTAIETASAGASAAAASTITTSSTTTITSSTSSPSSSSSSINNSSSSNNYNNSRLSRIKNRLHNDTENEEAQTRTRRRRCSFVGTAQYVSPELLQDGKITQSCDLWALGCIIYQMISGLPPFRGTSEYLIFRQILNLNLEFPEGFDSNAEDLVRSLLKLKPEERLGAQDKIGCYESIRTHPFFDGINWDAIRLQSPPTIYPYLPGANKEDELRSQYRVPENVEPGLNDKQLTRLLGLGLMGIEMGDKTEPKNNSNLSETELKNRLEAQKADKWNAFAEGELILRKGFVNKRKGLFARKRMLLLLTGPKLVYIDPVAMVKKGEIPWSPELRVEPKNFKIFFVHTPNRTYYLEDPDGYALKWVNAIENVRQQTYSNITTNNAGAAPL